MGYACFSRPMLSVNQTSKLQGAAAERAQIIRWAQDSLLRRVVSLAMFEPACFALAGAGQAGQSERIKCHSRAIPETPTSSHGVFYAHNNSYCAGNGSHTCCSILIPSLWQRRRHLILLSATLLVYLKVFVYVRVHP